MRPLLFLIPFLTRLETPAKTSLHLNEKDAVVGSFKIHPSLDCLPVSPLTTTMLSPLPTFGPFGQNFALTSAASKIIGTPSAATCVLLARHASCVDLGALSDS